MRGLNWLIGALLIAVVLVISPAPAAADNNPPSLPVVFYGNFTVDGAPAPVGQPLVISLKNSGTALANTTLSEAGQYFIEVDCVGYAGEPLLYRSNDLIIQAGECVDVLVTPSVQVDLVLDMANVTVDSQTSQINLNSDSETQINFSPTSTDTDGNVVATIGAGGLAVNRNSSDANHNFSLNFPAHTVITGPSAWDGSLTAPTVSSLSVNLPTEDNTTNQTAEVVKVGLSGARLTFDRGVSLLLPNMAGKRLGFSADGSDFTEITRPCSADNDSDLVGAVEECKIDRGAALVVWTKHFTNFVVFTSTPNNTGGGGGSVSAGGAAPITTACFSVEYEDWQTACADGWQYRNFKIFNPAGCQPTAEQRAAAKQPCDLVKPGAEALGPAAEKPVVKPETGGGEILGVKTYPDGTLLRDSQKRIFVVKEQMKYHIRSLRELAAGYLGQEIIDVPDELLATYSRTAIASLKIYADGTLLRNSRRQIFVVKGQAKQHIRTWPELAAKYRGQKIIEATDELLNNYKNF